MDVSEIRRRLQISPQAGIAWFAVDEADVAFAPNKSPGLRPVILRLWPREGPAAVVFARTSSGRAGVRHEPHDHASDYPRCWLDRLGHIVVGVPLVTKKSSLDHSTAMCDEPDPDITRQILLVPVRA